MDINFASALVNVEAETFSFGVITVLAVLTLILFANILRRKIKILRRSLLPTAVIAGLVGVAIKETVFHTTGINLLSYEVLYGLVYHLMAIGFIALCLRDKDDYAKDVTKEDLKKERVSGMRSGSLIVSTYLIQGIIGIAVTFVFSFVIKELNPASGIMLALGYGQGPNQATATGGIWDAAGYFSAWGADGGKNFGITIAAFGFLWASITGVILLNRIAKRRGIKLNQNEYEKSGQTLNQVIEEPNEIPLSECIDKFTLQVCMVGAVYLITIGLTVVLEILLNLSGIPFLQDLIPTFWGFSFMFAVLLALLAKMIMRRLFRAGVMKRKYPNSYMMNRISGAAFDISITAALIMMELKALGTLWWPILVLTTLGGIGTMLFAKFMCYRMYKDYKDEAFISMFGMFTGTINNGVILLRELDKDFKTPAANNLVIGSSSAIILGFPLLLLIAQSPREGNLWWISIVLVIYFAVLCLFQLKVFHKLFARKKLQPEQSGQSEQSVQAEQPEAVKSVHSEQPETKE